MREKTRLMSEEERRAYYKEVQDRKNKSRLQAESPDAITYWGKGKKHRTFVAVGKLVNLYWIPTRDGRKILASYVKCGQGLKRKIFYCQTKTAENQFQVMKRNTIVQMYGMTSYYSRPDGTKVFAHMVIEVGQFATHPTLSQVMTARENQNEKLWKKVTYKGHEEEITDVLQFIEAMSEDDD